MASSTHGDPRNVITPDAFDVSTSLLGLRLAPPRRRLAAILLDLLFIGFLTVATRSFGLILWALVGVLLLRAGFKRTPVRGSVFGRAMRLSVGCLGVSVSAVTVLLWIGYGLSGSPDAPGTAGRVRVTVSEEDGPMDLDGFSGVVARWAAEAAFEDAESLAEAEGVAVRMIEEAEELAVDRRELRELLLAAVPSDAPWADGAPALFDRLLEGEATDAIESREAEAVVAEISLYSTEEALEAYAELLRSGRDGEFDRARREAFEDRLAAAVAADTLGALERRVATLEEEAARQRRLLERTQGALDEATSGGFFGTLRDLLDEIGFGFGWATLYMTVMLTWWKGQTIGKRIMGIRVLSLDGAPISWWIAFERAGGYAAGFATGLLGFAQIYWDANRQAIHDRIVGTVVVLDKADKVIDWESAL